MTIRGWDPLGDILGLQERMNRLLEEALAPESLEAPLPGSASWTPVADVYETGDSFVVLMELAGIDENDVELGSTATDWWCAASAARSCPRGPTASIAWSGATGPSRARSRSRTPSIPSE